MKCDLCKKALISPTHDFIEMRDRGGPIGLTWPSSSAITICLEAERVLQRLLKKTGGKLPQGIGMTKAITTAVLNNTEDLQLFLELHNHQFETAVEDNHIHMLVQSVSSLFARIRFYHLGREFNDASTGQNIRHHLKRTIIFKHQ